MGECIITRRGSDTSDSNATENDILSGKTAYVNGSKIKGIIPVLATSWNGNNGGDANAFNDTLMIAGNANGSIDTNEYVAGIDIKIKQGYNGGGSQRFHLPNLLPQNIKAGTKVGFKNGYIEGTFTSDATANADLIVKGYSAYVKGNKLNGTIEPYYDGDEYENVPNTSTPGLVRLKPSQSIFLELGSQISRPEPNLIASNIVLGKNILGIVGTAKRSMSGTITCGSSRYNTITTNFQPSKVVYYSNPIMKDPLGRTYFAVISWDSNDPNNVRSMVYGFLDSNGQWSETSTGSYKFREGVVALQSGTTWVGPTSVCLPNMVQFGLIGFMNSTYTDYYMYYTIVE